MKMILTTIVAALALSAGVASADQIVTRETTVVRHDRHSSWQQRQEMRREAARREAERQRMKRHHNNGHDKLVIIKR
jgi:hypothetical protein